MNRPLLLIDVDGVISLFGIDPGDPPPGTFVSVDGILHLLSAVAAEQLLALGTEFRLVWCSGWEEKANEHLPLALGLPAGLPHLTFDGDGDGRHWKLGAIERFAGDDALAWIDDTHDAGCHAWAAARGAPTLLVTTDPAIGLTKEHAAGLRAWAQSLPQCSPRS